MSYDIPGLDWSAGRMIPAFQAVEHLDVYDMRGAARVRQLAASTCAGLINRPQPRVYVIFNDDDQYWLQQLAGAVPQTLCSARGNKALDALLTSYRPVVQGIIIYDPDLPDTVNVATTLAGQRDGIVLDPGLARELRTPYALPLLLDLRTFGWQTRVQAYSWAKEHLLAGCASRMVAGMNPGILNALRSFLVATRTFVYWLDTRPAFPNFSIEMLTERALVRQIYDEFPPGSLHLGWFVDEPTGVALTSQRAITVLASDYFDNLEVWTAIQPATMLEAMAKPTQDVARAQQNKVYISFTMSDGDNIQYCQHHMLGIWRDSLRGSLPIGWTLSPLLLEAAPALAAYYRETATENDELIAGPSGLGYIYPSLWPAEHLSHFLERTGEYMQQLGMTTLNVLDTDWLSRKGLPWLSRLSLTGMTFRNSERRHEFVRTLAPYGLQGMLSGAGFWFNNGGCEKVIDQPIYRNLGLAFSVDVALRLVERAVIAYPQRPLFLSLYILAWNLSLVDVQKIVERLGDGYEVVLPRTLLAMQSQALESVV